MNFPRFLQIARAGAGLTVLTLTASADNGGQPALDRPVERLQLDKAPLPAALRALGRSCQPTILVEPDRPPD